MYFSDYSNDTFHRSSAPPIGKQPDSNEEKHHLEMEPKPMAKGTWVALEHVWTKIKKVLDQEGRLAEVFVQLEDEAKKKKEKEPPAPIAEIKHMTLSEWGLLPTDTPRKRGPGAQNPRFVFEVLTEEPIIIRQGPHPWTEKEEDDKNDSKPATSSARSVSGIPKSWSKSPSQLLISSKPLVANFKDIVPNFNFDDIDELGAPLNTGKLLFMRPYKMFILYEKEIRDRHQELEKTFGAELNAKKASDKMDGPQRADGIPSQQPPIPDTVADEKDASPATDAPHHSPPKQALEDTSIDTATPNASSRTPIPIQGIATPSRSSETPEREKTVEKKEQKAKLKDDGLKNSITALEHFRLLIKFIDEDLKDMFELRRRVRSRELKKISFDDLWHLFDYGQEVLIRDREEPEKAKAYKVLKFTGGRRIRVTTKIDPPLVRPIAAALGPGMWDGAFAVQCWSLGFDSDLYWPQEKVVGIQRFDGERSITDLPVYPIVFDKRLALRQELITQGRIFKEFASAKSSHRRYLGPNLDKDARGEQIDSEVIVDFKEAINTNKHWVPESFDADTDQIDHDYRELLEDNPDSSYGKEKHWYYRVGPDIYFDQDIFNAFIKDNKHALEAKDNVEETDFLLLPDRVYGYVLNERRWAVLNIALLQEIQATSDPWKDLVLDRETKDTIEALVTQHLQKPDSGDSVGSPAQLGDFIAGKGRGLVFLLHGPPGVGKTSTAECIAAHMNKPLYSLTSGNLGIDPDGVEENLQSHFTLAERWVRPAPSPVQSFAYYSQGCILLLDEADVFLQRRRLSQLDINAIVSVFLRQLEYYKGILFLTTNRVGDMDPAFKSRVHASLEYKPLNRKRTRKIYKLHIRRIEEALELRKKSCGRKFRVEEVDILKWANKHYSKGKEKGRQWNGRQIHNAFQTAVALAEWESRNGQQKTGASEEKHGKLKKLVLGVRQFEQVAKVSEGFDQYMTDLMGGRDENSIAAVQRQRLDRRVKEQKSRKDSESESESDEEGQSSDSSSDEEPKKKGKVKTNERSGKERSGKAKKTKDEESDSEAQKATDKEMKTSKRKDDSSDSD
jgi:ATPase family associated with various cellular activities (AAA)